MWFLSENYTLTLFAAEAVPPAEIATEAVALPLKAMFQQLDTLGEQLLLHLDTLEEQLLPQLDTLVGTAVAAAA